MRFIQKILSLLPVAPNTNDLNTFEARWDEFGEALPNSVIEQNELRSQMNDLAEDVGTAAALTLEFKNAAEASAQAAANNSNSDEWFSGVQYDKGTVRWSPITFLSYRAKVVTDGDVDPSLSADWALQAYDEPIDKRVRHLTMTAYTLLNGFVVDETYEGGYKVIYTFISGLLTKEEYTNTDGVTVLLTITYDWSGGYPKPTRS